MIYFNLFSTYLADK